MICMHHRFNDYVLFFPYNNDNKIKLFVKTKRCKNATNHRCKGIHSKVILIITLKFYTLQKLHRKKTTGQGHKADIQRIKNSKKIIGSDRKTLKKATPLLT